MLRLDMDLVAAGWVLHVLVPILLGLLVLAAAWIGVRWVGSEHLDLARSARLFGGLTDRQVRSLIGSARRIEFGPGDAIVKEGAPGGSFFLIRRGKANVSVNGKELARLGPGSHFGELALIDDGPRTATVTAEMHTVMVEVPSSGFRRVLDADPAASRAIQLQLRKWLAEAGEPPPPSTEEPAEHEAIAQLCQRLREVRAVDWAEGRAPSRRWLWERR